MLENFKRLLKVETSKPEIIKFILEQEEHKWIHADAYVLANMQDFLERMPRRVLHKVFCEKMTIFVRANGRFACTVSSLQQNVIIVFPELYTLLTKTYDGWAKAVLAHEVGHIYLEHSKMPADPMEAQVDADTFACEMGYLEELESFLHEQGESVEKRVRLSFVSSYYFSHYGHEEL